MTAFTTPVIILAYNRPEPTRLVLEMIRQIRPTRLLVVADGPNPGRLDDQEKCAKVRQLFDTVDWTCKIERNYADTNMGSRRRVASGLTWAFEQVEEAIILEDDCLPTPDFFQYCADLLEFYRHDTRIMHIGGTNLAPAGRHASSSYFFSRYALSWGWATWARAWSLYDHELEAWPEIRDGNWLGDYLDGDEASIDTWTERCEVVFRGEFDSWATIWMLSCWMNNALATMPKENLIHNIGLGGADATHTGSAEHAQMVRETGRLEFPLQHPKIMVRDRQSDAFHARTPLMVKDYFGLRGRLRRWRRRRARKN